MVRQTRTFFEKEFGFGKDLSRIFCVLFTGLYYAWFLVAPLTTIGSISLMTMKLQAYRDLLYKSLIGLNALIIGSVFCLMIMIGVTSTSPDSIFLIYAFMIMIVCNPVPYLVGAYRTDHDGLVRNIVLLFAAITPYFYMTYTFIQHKTIGCARLF